MKRRELLGVIGAGVLAGCVSGEVADSQPDETNQSDENATADGEDEGLVAEATVTGSELATREADDRTEAAATGTIENTGDVRLGAVTAVGKFFDADGQLLSSAMWDIRDLEVGEVWEPWIPYSESAEKVAEVELSVTQATAHGWTVSPDGLVLESHDVQVPTDDHAMPRVVGEVANETETDASNVQARPKIYAENGNLLETGIKTTQQLGAGETWQFDVQVHFNNPDWKDRIGDSDVTLTV